MKAAIVALVMLAAHAAEGRQVSYAIVIGNNAPPRTGTSEQLQPLRYADDDAVRYFQLFARLGEAHLFAVLDTQTQKRYPGMAEYAQPPTLDNLAHVVDDLALKMRADRQRGDQPVLYFAFSGHGARDDHGEPFLAMLDGALTQQKLYDGVLGRMPTTYTHLIVDACNAGGVVGVRGGFFAHETDARAVPVTPAEVEPILQATPLARYPNIGVILATTLGQESHEWSAIESGVFTHELLSGLVGAADVNGDLVIEYTEVQAFVASANRDIKDPRAIPQVIARPPAANQRAPLVALASLAGTRLVRGDASPLGHFHIELDNGQRYLDAHADGKTTIAIAVPDAQAAFLRTDTAEASLPVRGAIALARLVLADRDVASRGSIESSYRTALFASGYGRAYYKGFVDSTGELGVSFEDEAPRSRTPGDHATRRTIAISSAVVGGVAALASITTGVLAYEAHADFEATTLQAAAHDAQVRYDRYLPLAIGAGAVAVVAGAAAYLVWPRSPVTVVPTAEHGTYAVGVGGTW
jgi:hypothetical protein